MSHQEKIQRINAELNTTEVWSRRWQIEREHNERLAAEAEKVRTGVHGLRARALRAYNTNRQRSLGQQRADEASIFQRQCEREAGAMAALDTVLELMDTVSKEP